MNRARNPPCRARDKSGFYAKFTREECLGHGGIPEADGCRRSTNEFREASGYGKHKAQMVP
jgi:hypothetical protein